MASKQSVALKWLGHSAFLIRNARGTTIAIDPWLSNPTCPPAAREIDRLDIMLISHGHGDHLGDAVTVGTRFQPKVIANYEIGTWLASKGLQNTLAMNTGGTVEVDGIRVTLVPAEHSSSISDNGTTVYGGNPNGFVVEIDGLRLYHAGDTAVFMGMKLIGELYEPDVACLPIGDYFTMGPREAAKACELLGVKRVVPMHYGTFPVLTGTPAMLRDAVRRSEVEVLEMPLAQEIGL